MKKQPVRGQAADKRQGRLLIKNGIKIERKQSASGVPSKKNYLI
jgi:hypothetical protein